TANGSVTSPTTTSTAAGSARSGPRSGNSARSTAASARTRSRTWWPRCSSARTEWEPTYPVPPVTATSIRDSPWVPGSGPVDGHRQAVLDPQGEHRLTDDLPARLQLQPELAGHHRGDEDGFHHSEVVADAEPRSGAERDVGVPVPDGGLVGGEPLRVEPVRG